MLSESESDDDNSEGDDEEEDDLFRGFCLELEVSEKSSSVVVMLMATEAAAEEEAAAATNESIFRLSPICWEELAMVCECRLVVLVWYDY